MLTHNKSLSIDVVDEEQAQDLSPSSVPDQWNTQAQRSGDHYALNADTEDRPSATVRTFCSHHKPLHYELCRAQGWWNQFCSGPAK